MPKRVVELSPFNSDSEDDINDVNKRYFRIKRKFRFLLLFIIFFF